MIKRLKSIGRMGVSRTLRIGFLSLLFVSVTGCEPHSVDPVRSDARTAMLVIDLGVVSSDYDFYVCLPFERLGLREAQEIESVYCSCPCAKSSIVSYQSPKGILNSVRIDLKKDDANLESPVLLAIELKLKIKESSDLNLVLNLMQTSENLVVGRRLF